MLRWHGEEIRRRVVAASKEGIDSTMAAAVIHAKTHHLFKNRTGTLEGSINIYQYATEEGSAVVGRWGSADVLYALFVELGTARSSAYPYLRPAADETYPRLAGLIQKAFRSGL